MEFRSVPKTFSAFLLLLLDYVYAIMVVYNVHQHAVTECMVNALSSYLQQELDNFNCLRS